MLEVEESESGTTMYDGAVAGTGRLDSLPGLKVRFANPPLPLCLL